MPAGVNSTDGSQRGTSTSLGRRTQPLDSKNDRYFSRNSSVFICKFIPLNHHSDQSENRTKPWDCNLWLCSSDAESLRARARYNDVCDTCGSFSELGVLRDVPARKSRPRARTLGQSADGT